MRPTNIEELLSKYSNIPDSIFSRIIFPSWSPAKDLFSEVPITSTRSMEEGSALLSSRNQDSSRLVNIFTLRSGSSCKLSSWLSRSSMLGVSIISSLSLLYFSPFKETTSMLCFELTGIVLTVNSRFNAAVEKLSRASSQSVLKKISFIFSCILVLYLRKFFFSLEACINPKILIHRTIEFCKNICRTAIEVFLMIT